MSKKPEKPKAKRGPKAELFKIDGNWEDAVAQSLKKKRPETGWPKEPPKK